MCPHINAMRKRCGNWWMLRTHEWETPGGSVSKASDSWFQLRSWSHGSWVQVPSWALCWQRGACLGFSVSLSLCLSPACALSLSLSLKINKLALKKKEHEWAFIFTNASTCVYFYVYILYSWKNALNVSMSVFPGGHIMST